jgi:hypothetical protein
MRPQIQQPCWMLGDSSGYTALMHTAWNGNVAAMRLLLDHPSANPAVMLMHTSEHGWTAVMRAAQSGMVDAMRLLLDHPSADPAAMLAFDSAAYLGHGYSALLGAAWFATRCGYGPEADGSPARAFAPLLFLLRRVAADPQPGDAQQAHMNEVVEILVGRAALGHDPDEEDSEGEEERKSLLSDDQPDNARDECVRLLLELDADIFNLPRCPVISRIIRECVAMARVPQLLNEAVLGVAIARQ